MNSDVFFCQPEDGYRINQDSIRLSSFVPDSLFDQSFLDIGSGSAIIPLMLARRGFRHIFSIEIQPCFMPYSVRNILSNNLESNILPVLGDARVKNCCLIRSSFNNIISNPPYYRKDSGLAPRTKHLCISKQEITLSCSDLFYSVDFLLKRQGNFFVSVAFIRLGDYLRVFSNGFILMERVDISRKTSLLWFRKK